MYMLTEINSTQIIQNNSRPKANYQIVYCSLKNMSLGGIGDCGHTKYQNFDSIFEERKISRKGKAFGKSIPFDVIVYFFRIDN